MSKDFLEKANRTTWYFDKDKYREELNLLDIETLKIVLNDRLETLNFTTNKIFIIYEILDKKIEELKIKMKKLSLTHIFIRILKNMLCFRVIIISKSLCLIRSLFISFQRFIFYFTFWHNDNNYEILKIKTFGF